MKIIIPWLKNNLSILGLLIGFQVLILNCSNTAESKVNSETLSNLHAAKPGKTLSSDEICNIAKSTTVLILSEDNRSRGTGFLIHEKSSGNGIGFQYKVVTNDHVLTDAPLYKIQTPDKTVHIASKLYSFGSPVSGKDLTILQFETTKKYEIAKLAHGLSLSPDTSVIAAGYPLRTGAVTESEWVCTNPSIVRFVLDKPMKGGYRIGYFLGIRKGMSGGPLFNLQGQVVGINGKHRRPPFGGRSVYRYEDETFVEEELSLLQESSWAIPIEALVPRAMSQGICLAYDDREKIPECKKREANLRPIEPPSPSPTNYPSPEPKPTITPVSPSPKPSPTGNETHGRNSGNDNNVSDLTDDKLKQLAEGITVEVRIRKTSKTDKTESFSRSGFVVEKKLYQQQFLYKVVTYVEEKTDPKDVLYLYQVIGRGGNSIPIIGKPIETVTSNGGRLVQIQFLDRQDRYYETAKFGDFDLKKGDKVFASGCKTDTKKYSNENQGAPECKFTKGTVKNINNWNGSQTYQLDAINITEEMLGGPLINSQGKVIGINTSGASSNFSGSAIPIREYLSNKGTLEL